MKIKRILAGGLAALTTGATLAFGIYAAGLGDYVQTSDGSLASPIIAIGAPSSPSSDFALDVIGAADIAAAVAGYATTTIAIPGAAASVGVSGAEDLSTTTTKLYMGSMIDSAKQTITAQDLPTVLKSGKVSVSGVEYKYDQYINLGARRIKFDKSNAELYDPEVYVDIGTSEASPIYNTTVVFNKALNVSSTSVRGKKIEFFGSDYTIGAASVVYSGGAANNKLVFFGYGTSTQLDEGADSVTISVEGVDHEVKLVLVTSDSTALVSIDGIVSDDALAGGDSAVISGVNVYVKNVYYLGGTRLGQAYISFGSSKLTLQHGSEVKYGESDTTVDNTLVSITGDNSGISKLVISVAAKDSSVAFATKDSAFTDPVWASFKIGFNGLTPDLTSSARDTITIDNSGTTAATVKMTDYRGNEKTMTFAVTGTTSWDPQLNSTTSRKFVVAEGVPIKKNDYFALAPSQESEFSHLYQLSGLSSIGTTSASVQLTDVFSGDSNTIYLTDTVGNNLYAGKDFYVDGQTYHVAAIPNANTSVRFFWGTGSDQTNPGPKQSVFSLVKLHGGEFFSFVEAAAPLNGTVYDLYSMWFELPGGDLNVSYNGSEDFTTVYMNGAANTTADYQVVTIGEVAYNLTFTGTAASATISAIRLSDAYFVSTPATNNANRIGILVYEEKDNATVENAVILSISKDTSGYMVAAAPKFTFASSLTGWSDTLGSDSSIQQYVDPYGTFVTHDSDSQGVAVLYYPDTQGVATVAIGSSPAFSVAEGVSGTVESATKITSPVAKLASEVSTTTLASDLILVGGPCANSLVAQLLDSDEQCDNWPYSEGIIKEVSDAFGSGQKALIVAGTLATDTRALAAKVMQGTLSYSN